MKNHALRISLRISFSGLRRRYENISVVFAEPGDLVLLGARTLEGLNLTVDDIRKKLVAADPLPAA